MEKFSELQVVVVVAGEGEGGRRSCGGRYALTACGVYMYIHVQIC